MTLKNVVESLGFEVSCGGELLEREVVAGFSGDLLSDVIAGAPEASVWITRQIHQNIVAVASLRDIAGIIVASGSALPADTLEKARMQGVPIVISPYGSFETAGKVYALLAPDQAGHVVEKPPS